MPSIHFSIRKNAEFNTGFCDILSKNEYFIRCSSKLNSLQVKTSSAKWKWSQNRSVESDTERKTAVILGKFYFFSVEMIPSRFWIFSTLFWDICISSQHNSFNRSDPHLGKSRQAHNIFTKQLYPGSVISIRLLGNAKQTYCVCAV